MEAYKNKLIAGKNESQGGYQKFASAQFYENLTNEAYTGVQPKSFNQLSTSRDTLNPLLNVETLRNRLAVIEHYKLLRGEQHTFWPHYGLTNVARHLNRYKFNYAVKAFAAYIVYRDYVNYQHMNSRAFLSLQKQSEMIGTGALHLGVFACLCAFI